MRAEARRAGGRTPLRLGLAMVAVAVLGGLAGARHAAADPAGVFVSSYTPGRIELGEAPYVIVRGLVTNSLDIPAGNVDVTMRLRRSPGGELLAPPVVNRMWLGTLNPGESGPFATFVKYCCPDEVGAYEFSVAWQGTAEPRYTGLRAELLATRDWEGTTRLFGELANDGPRFTDASTTRLYLGFWSGDRLVDARSALMPLVYEDGAGGVSQPPGFRVPWSSTVPEEPYDRIELWPVVEPYPPGGYPVPLGLRDITVRTAERGVVVGATLYNCGRVASEGIVLMVVARDEEGRPLQFDKAVLTADHPLAPGEAGGITLTWPSARPEVAGSHVDLYAFAVESQVDRPAAVPCRAPSELFLPMAERAAAMGVLQRR